MTQALLKAVQEQVTNKGIIHLDLKPENIIADLGPPISVHILDYGLSIDAKNPNGKQSGSPSYYSPEIVADPFSITGKADVFSIARVIALVWHGINKTYQDEDVYKAALCAPNAEDLLLENLGASIPTLKAEQKNIILDILTAMLKIKPEERISIEEAITKFSKLTPKQKPAPSNLQKTMRDELAQMRATQSTGCFNSYQIQKIKNVINLLVDEYNSTWFYSNKDRKVNKIEGLKKLIEIGKTTESIVDAINQVKAMPQFSDLEAGMFSTRTANLLTELQADEPAQVSTKMLNH